MNNTDVNNYLKVAQEIVDKHLGSAATEPVNVDAVARSSTADSLQVNIWLEKIISHSS